MSAGVAFAVRSLQCVAPSILSNVKIPLIEGTFDTTDFTFSYNSRLLTKMYCTAASFKINSTSMGLVVGYNGTRMAPICCVAKSVKTHSGLLPLMMAILSLPSGVKSFPEIPNDKSPALNLFTLAATLAVL